ncbi:tail protein [Klebsiella phage LASTA]|uniref:Tail fiber protein n=1 Tax=Klebsiella phage LASTA TaxID=2723758 RepID=A0A6H0X3B4_9CAUD|nr:tail protein [Klebsiella phage LASTA]QIW86640.1 tail fiber protein [Klebsiella phage LASTA]
MTNLSGATTAVFIISLSSALEVPVNVDWETKDGTAKAGTDYEAASGSVTFEAGDTQKQIQVAVYGRETGDTTTRKFSILFYPPENAILDQTLNEVEIQVTDSEGVAVTSLVVATGPRGIKGDPGLSAYELAKLQGFEGTLQDWLEIQNPSAEMLEKAEEAEKYANEAKRTKDEIQIILENAGEQSTLVALAQPNGYSKIGGFFSGEGKEASGDINQSVMERIFKRGEFEIHQMPGDPAGVAGIVFGGPNNKAAVVVDERGRIQTYAIVDGKLSAAQISTPIVQGTGYFNNGFEDKIVRFPSAGNESDDLSPGILITTNADGIIDIFVVSPNQFNDLGYPTGSSIDKQMFKLVKSFDIGTSLQRTIDQCPTVENSSPVLYRLFDVNYSGYGSKVVSGILSVGNYVNYTPNVYMVTFNPQALNAAPSIDQGSIYQWLKVTALHGGQSGWGDSALTPAVGLVNDPNNSVAKLFLRLPSYGQKISFTPINIANPNVVTFYHNDLRNNVTVDTPNYLVYSFAEKMATDRFYVKMNNGDVRYSPGTVVRVTGDMTYRLSDKLSDGVFAIGGPYHLANKGQEARIAVTNPSTGQYVISGCNLRGDHWKVCPPAGFSGTSFGTPPYIVNIVSQGTNTFTIEVRTSAGTLVNISGSDWVDLHVQPA